MEWWLLTFFLGAILSLFLPIVPEISLLFLILIVAFILFRFHQLRLLAVLIFAGCWLLMSASHQRNTLANNGINLAEQPRSVVIVKGTINNIVTHQQTTNRFNFMVSHWQNEKLNTPFVIRLNWQKPSQQLLQGQRWQLAVKLKPAHGLANTGGFNYQVWLMHNHIVATGYVKQDTAKSIKKSGTRNNRLLSSNVAWRQKLYQKFTESLAKEPMQGVLIALGFGERSKLTAAQWQVLSTTATVHLIAISGLHIGIVAYFSFFLARGLLRILPLHKLLTSRQQIKLMAANVKYLPIVLSCGIAWYYAYLAGYSIPTLRALVMLLLFWLLKLSAINVSLIRWLLLTILIILLFWPLSLLSASFWLSVSALTIIFITSSRLLTKVASDKVNKTSQISTETSDAISTTKRKLVVLEFLANIKQRGYLWVKSLLIVQFALTIAMLPIAALLNYQLPLLAFFANIIAVPLMSVTTIPLMLFSVLSAPINDMLSQLFLYLAHSSMELIWQWLTFLSQFTWPQWSISFDSLSLLYFVTFSLFSVVYFRLNKFVVVIIVSASAVVISLTLFMRQSEDSWQLSVLDVGHGLAVIIEKNQRVFLYDTGAKYPSGFNLAQAAILPYLKHNGYDAIDGIIISHNDNDHAGGLSVLRQHLDIAKVIANDNSLSPDQHCLSGESFTWQGLRFEMLSPVQVVGDKNDDSCVVVISDGVHRVLLPGDISAKQEWALVNKLEIKDKLVSDVLIAPHHGSKSSSSNRFLATVAPSYAVFSSGYLNQWHMPSEEIRQRYQQQNIKTFNTAELGMVTLVFDKLEIKPLTFRGDIKPYWFVN